MSGTHGPIWAGLHMCYNGGYKKMQWGDPEPNSKSPSQSRLILATQDHEVEITSNRESERHGE